MSEVLLAPSFLFRFSVPFYRCAPEVAEQGGGLEERHVVAGFGDLDGRPNFAELRGGWSGEGLAFSLRVSGKRQQPWCRENLPLDSDGLRLWIDTRDTHNIHRAGRFCHKFVFLPSGTGRGLAEPCGSLVPIHRARENPKPIRPNQFRLRSEKRIDGYLLDVFIPASALTGYDPEEHSRLGFCYAVVDRERKMQTFGVGPEFPFDEDPSLWGTLELI